MFGGEGTGPGDRWDWAIDSAVLTPAVLVRNPTNTNTTLTPKRTMNRDVIDWENANLSDGIIWAKPGLAATILAKAWGDARICPTAFGSLRIAASPGGAPERSPDSRLLRMFVCIAPRTETPIAPPRFRVNVERPDAIPMSFLSTEF